MKVVPTRIVDRTKRKFQPLVIESLEDRRLMANDLLQIQSSPPESRDFLVQVSHFNPSQPILRVGERIADATVAKQISSDGWYVIQVDSGKSLSVAMSAFQARNDVQIVTPDYNFSIQTTPSDPTYASQWGA